MAQRTRNRLWIIAALAAMPTLALAAAAENKPPRLPFALLVINRENHEAYVYPASAAAAYEADPVTADFRGAGPKPWRFLPMPAFAKALATPEEINSLAQNLATRSAIYGQTLVREMRGLNLVTSEAWATAVLRVVGRAGLLQGAHRRDVRTDNALANGANVSDSAQSGGTPAATLAPNGEANRYAWPPALPLLMTVLAQPDRILTDEAPAKGSATTASDQTRRAGALFVIECRSDDKAGVVEQIDLMAFRDGRLARTYWSRDALDPTYFVKTDKALSQVASRFKQRIESLMTNEPGLDSAAPSQPAEVAAPAVVVGIHRLLADGARPSLVKAAQSLGDGKAHVPLPTAVDKDYIFYTVELRRSADAPTDQEPSPVEALRASLVASALPDDPAAKKPPAGAATRTPPAAGAKAAVPAYEVNQAADGSLRLDPHVVTAPQKR